MRKHFKNIINFIQASTLNNTVGKYRVLEEVQK